MRERLPPGLGMVLLVVLAEVLLSGLGEIPLRLEEILL